MKKNIVLSIIVAIFFILLGAYFGSRHPAEKSSSAVQSFYSQSLPDKSGQLTSFSKWKGKSLIVNFWATWCPPCVQEIPELSALQTETAAKHIQIIGIGIDSSTNINNFASKYTINYPVYVAGINGMELARQFGNQAGGLPFTVLIGADGNIKKIYLGRLKFEELRRDLASF
jgi:thiol-disulfide isomerase/thioredoxin